jgi:hypothetical protein
MCFTEIECLKPVKPRRAPDKLGELGRAEIVGKGYTDGVEQRGIDPA